MGKSQRKSSKQSKQIDIFIQKDMLIFLMCSLFLKGVISLSPDALKNSGSVPSSFADSILGQHLKSKPFYFRTIKHSSFEFLNLFETLLRSEIWVSKFFATKIV